MTFLCLFSFRYLSIAESMEATDVLNPALNYGIVVDCGSSGSRVFVYYWPPHNGNPHTLLDIRQMKDRDHKPVVKKIKPGEEFLVSSRVIQGRATWRSCDKRKTFHILLRSFSSVANRTLYSNIFRSISVLPHGIDGCRKSARREHKQTWRRVKMTEKEELTLIISQSLNVINC